MTKRESTILVCQQCGIKVKVWTKGRKYCTRQCAGLAKRKIMGKMYIGNKGYVRVYFRGHPLANKNGEISGHWLVAYDYPYEFNLTREEIVEMRDSKKWTIHHINGKRDDNNIKNLEFRMKSKHPTGMGIGDAIKILEANGYSISKDEKNG